jgi:hypothetical protein
MMSCQLKNIPLMPGTYNLDLYLGKDGQSLDIIYDACQFEVHPADVFGSGRIPASVAGSIFWPASWRITPADLPEPVGPGGEAVVADFGPDRGLDRERE